VRKFERSLQENMASLLDVSQHPIRRYSGEVLLSQKIIPLLRSVLLT
jgi:hypothetical protein